MHNPAVQFDGVSFGFGRSSRLFENLNCRLSPRSHDTGTIIALIGPSGVGKTTFCDLVLGVIKPQTGVVLLSPQHARAAFIPQKGVIFDELTVRENIGCMKYSQSLGSTFREHRVDQAAKALGLSALLNGNTASATLSGGEAQRVMLARTQTVDCDLLVLDEPCSFLDNRVKESFLRALRQTVDDRKLLALFVTHAWEEARAVADEVLFFHRHGNLPATLHRCTVAEASHCPPTVDSLYAIHWPTCALFGVETIEMLPAHLRRLIPESAKHVGFYLDPDEALKGSPLTHDLLVALTDLVNRSEMGADRLLASTRTIRHQSYAYDETVIT